jgi:hypothetical protein
MYSTSKGVISAVLASFSQRATKSPSKTKKKVVRGVALMENLIGILAFIGAACEWGINIGEVRYPNLKDENSSSNLNWLYLAMAFF